MNNGAIPEEIIGRMRKILAMQQSTNPHEAANAAAILQRMLTQYQLSISDIERNDPGEAVEEIDIDTASTRNQTGPCLLMAGIARGSGCTILVSKNGRRTIWHLIGHRSDTALVQQLYAALLASLTRQAQTECQHMMLRPGECRAYLRAFLIGASSVIEGRLKAQRRTPEHVEQAAQCTALVIVKDKAVDAYMAEKHPRLRHTTCSVGNYGAYQAGQRAGNSASLSRGVTSNSSRLLS